MEAIKKKKMGLDYKIYRPKEKLEIKEQIRLIHKTYNECPKTEYSEYYAEFNLNNIEKFKTISENWQIVNNTYGLSNLKFAFLPEEVNHLISDQKLYDSCRIFSEGFYEEDTFGYELTVDRKKSDLKICIGIPQKNLEESKKKVKELILHLYREGIYFGLTDYNVEDCVNQFIELNSSTGANSFVNWQLNASDYQFSHGKRYSPNSRYNDKNSKTYRLATFLIGLPNWYFKQNDRIEYTLKLLKSLDSYFSDKVNIQFSSSNLNLIDMVCQLKKSQFDLGATIDLSKSEKPISLNELTFAFEDKENEICAYSLKLSKIDFYSFNLNTIKNKEEKFKFRIYIDYKADDNYKERIENKLGLELEYESSE